MPKIVVLDGFTLNPSDLDWQMLHSLGSCAIYERTAAEDTVDRAKEAEMVLTNKVVLSRSVLEQLTRLRYIGVLATGFNVVDIEAARERGIVVTNVPAYSTLSVAQMTFALLLEITHHVGHHSQTVREGRWSKSVDFCYWDYPLLELMDKTLGIVGYGQIGQAVARIGRAMGMRILAFDPAQRKDPGVTFVETVDTLFREADVLSLHCPLTAETRGLVNAASLSQMKPGAILINTSRGPLIDDQALANALKGGHLAAAGLDVLVDEPPDPDNPLLYLENCYITPHIAWATFAARSRLLRMAVENVAAFIQGTPINVVNN